MSYRANPGFYSVSHVASSFYFFGAVSPTRPAGFQAPQSRKSSSRFRAAASCAIAILFVAGFAHCKKKPEPPPLEVLQRYPGQADRLCRAVVKCIKEDTARRLADQPQQRDMVLARMGQDLCVKNQYQLIGRLSTEPLGAGAADYDEALYQRYGKCVSAVEAAVDCEARRRQYFEHPECRGLRDARLQS